tara:strand:+ start:97 stop:246 length:150 start_codon:yes stop_codon:yes gene_type:complete
MEGSIVKQDHALELSAEFAQLATQLEENRSKRLNPNNLFTRYLKYYIDL